MESSLNLVTRLPVAICDCTDQQIDVRPHVIPDSRICEESVLGTRG